MTKIQLVQLITFKL